MTQPQTLELVIDSMTAKGDGVARHGGRTIYVRGALPGETVQVVLEDEKPRYAQGRLLNVVQADADRVTNFCPHQQCGGCQLGHLAYPAQLVRKQQLVEAALAKHQLAYPVQPCLGMETPFAYRNKVLYAVQPGADGAELGFYQINSHALVACDDCAVQPALVPELVAEVRAWLRDNAISAYDETQHSGEVRYLMLRDGRTTGEWMLVIVTLGETLTAQDDLLARLARWPQLRTVVHNINPQRGNRILGFDNRVLQGEGVISDELDGLRFDLSPLAFYQINPAQTAVLYRAALAACGLTGHETVFDIYCGIGTISLFLARQAAKVVGIELVPEAIDDARANAARNGLTHTEFHAGKAEEVVPALYAQGYRADVVVVDPPRKGCERIVLQTIVQMAPRTVVYVSCDADSLARDLAWLATQGYHADSVQPVDMFPHTLHVESVVRLTRAG